MSSVTAETDRIYKARHYALGILVVVYTFNFIDRQILSILLEPVKTDLGLSDTQMGLLTGFAFAMFYATLGIPIARFADRTNRRNLIAAALAIWSGFTALSGLAQNFWHMLAARIGVGVGEAGCSPPAHSMIADYYPAEQRATALGIYSLGIPFGIMFGLFAGGWINEFFGWRAAFFVVGVPGLLLAILVRYSLAEPPRGMAEGRTDSGEQPSIGETLAYLWQKKSFRHMSFAAALTAFVGYGFVTWAPAFLIRSFGMGTGEIGTWFGLILGVAGGIGIAGGGYLADKFWSQRRQMVSLDHRHCLIGGHTVQPAGLFCHPVTHGPAGNGYSGPAGQFLSSHHFQPNPRHFRTAHARRRGRYLAVHHQLHRPRLRPASGRYCIRPSGRQLWYGKPALCAADMLLGQYLGGGALFHRRSPFEG